MYGITKLFLCKDIVFFDYVLRCMLDIDQCIIICMDLSIRKQLQPCFSSFDLHFFHNDVPSIDAARTTPMA